MARPTSPASTRASTRTTRRASSSRSRASSTTRSSTETCNNLDDDCDMLVDEDFTKGTACSNGRLGECRVVGTTVCRADGTGTQCNARSQPACTARPTATACTVVNATSTTPCSGRRGHRASDLLADRGGNAGQREQRGPVRLQQPRRRLRRSDRRDVTGCACIPQGEICNGDDDDCDGTSTRTRRFRAAPARCTRHPSRATGAAAASALHRGARPTRPRSATASTTTATASPMASTRGVLEHALPGGAAPVALRRAHCVGGTRAGLRCDTFPAFDPRNNPGGNPASACEMLGAAVRLPPRQPDVSGQRQPGMFGACVQRDPAAAPRSATASTTTATAWSTRRRRSRARRHASAPPMTPTAQPEGMPNMGTCQPADCSTNAAVGQLVCVERHADVQPRSAPNDDTCNGIDDDCDMMIDEDWLCTDPTVPTTSRATPTTARARAPACATASRVVRERRRVVCDGDPVGQESCNCLDDNCNGEIDEGALCGAGATCTSCQCAFPCSPASSRARWARRASSGFCLADPCFNVHLPAVAGRQADRAALGDQPERHGSASRRALRASHNCNAPATSASVRPASASPTTARRSRSAARRTRTASTATCVTNPCQGVTCAAGQYCVGGQCFGSCADVDCPTGERCRLGMCEADPCGTPCPFGQACHDDAGSCIDEPVRVRDLPAGSVVQPEQQRHVRGRSVRLRHECARPGEVCVGGTCYDPRTTSSRTPASRTHVTTGGGGGCSTGGGAGGSLLARSRRWCSLASSPPARRRCVVKSILAAGARRRVVRRHGGELAVVQRQRVLPQLRDARRRWQRRLGRWRRR